MLKPGLFPIASFFIICSMLVLSLISVATIAIIIYLNRKNKKYSSVSKLILGIAMLPFLWITCEIIHYTVLLNQYNHDCIGAYYYEGTNTKVLELNEDGHWSADQTFPCSTGDWRLVPSEDGFYIELESYCNDQFYTEQLWLGKNNTLSIYGHKIVKK